MGHSRPYWTRSFNAGGNVNHWFFHWPVYHEYHKKVKLLCTMLTFTYKIFFLYACECCLKIEGNNTYLYMYPFNGKCPLLLLLWFFFLGRYYLVMTMVGNLYLSMITSLAVGLQNVVWNLWSVLVFTLSSWLLLLPMLWLLPLWALSMMDEREENFINIITIWRLVSVVINESWRGNIFGVFVWKKYICMVHLTFSWFLKNLIILHMVNVTSFQCYI